MFEKLFEKRSRAFTAEELRQMGIKTFGPDTIDMEVFEPKKIKINRTEIDRTSIKRNDLA